MNAPLYYHYYYYVAPDLFMVPCIFRSPLHTWVGNDKLLSSKKVLSEMVPFLCDTALPKVTSLMPQCVLLVIFLLFTVSHFSEIASWTNETVSVTLIHSLAVMHDALKPVFLRQLSPRNHSIVFSDCFLCSNSNQWQHITYCIPQRFSLFY